MIRAVLRRLFQPHAPTPPPPDVLLTSDDERARIERRQREVVARMERLRLEAERPALRHIEELGR